jgi:predicted dehydrogenase
VRNGANGHGPAPIRIAVLGLGHWGPNLVRCLNELPEFQLAYACDLRPEALDRIARRYPSIPRTTRFDEILSDPRIEAVAIATPVSTHSPLASAALAAGKHVFVEKPLAASTREAEALIALARAQRLTLMPGHTFLYSPAVNLVRKLIASNALGDIYFVSMSRVNLGQHQPDVSVVWDLAPHDFSILRYWLGEEPTRIVALSRGCIVPETPDVAFINLEFPSGTIAHVELAWLAPSKLRRTAVVGAHKMVVYDDTGSEPVRIFDSGVDPLDPISFGEHQLSYRAGDIVSPRVDAVEPLSLELRDLYGAVRHGTTPRSSAEFGLEIVRMLEKVDRSLAVATSPAPGEVVPV